MKAVTKIFAVLLLFVSSSAFEVISQTKGLNHDGKRIVVTFSNVLKSKHLDKIKTELAQTGIMLQYDHLDFDKKGRLVDIKFSVDCKDGFSGSGETTGLTKKSKFGFFRDYAADATATKSPFGTGDLSEINNK